MFNRVKFAVMNPELTFTLPKYQLACGITDIMMHTMERYFIPGIKCQLTDEIAEGLLRTVVENGKIAMENQRDYDAMAEIMWCFQSFPQQSDGSGKGKRFLCAQIRPRAQRQIRCSPRRQPGRCLGLLGKLSVHAAPDRFARFARKVWGIREQEDLKAAREGIRAAVDYFRSIGMPVSLTELGIHPTEEELKALALDATMNDTVKLSRLKPLGAAEALEIYRMAC